ncbi:MAG TPA: threonylcarbamoyl-AMP synthase [Bacteroidales bacterium]|nr:threonylcarbamoyl-AMP synthase [Bacteroidales bacterium]
MLLKIHSETPDPRRIHGVVETLRKGGIIIYPTDTVYALGCDIFQHKAIEKIARIKNIDPNKAHFSFVCHDLSHLSDYSQPLENNVFKLLKRNLPGPFTFILEANSEVPKRFRKNKKTVGIRIPKNNIALEIVRQLGHPILSTSLISDDDILEYYTDPELIHEKYVKLVDLVIDGGIGGLEPSTIVDCTKGDIEIIREGLGNLQI